MNQVNHQPGRATETDLKRLAEPLASYICAVDNPKAAWPGPSSSSSTKWARTTVPPGPTSRSWRELLGVSPSLPRSFVAGSEPPREALSPPNS